MAVAVRSRDRVTIDLRGIGDAVRLAAAQRSMTIAALARHALVELIGIACEPSQPPASMSAGRRGPLCKLTLRLPQRHAEALMMNATAIGRSYGDYVAHLVSGTPLPALAAVRMSDRAALRASTDQLAALSADLNDLVRLLRAGRSEEAQKHRQRLEHAHADIQRHLDLASAFLAEAT
jgi:hypothetical protein